MALQTSGAISLSNVNVELGRSSTAQISLGETAVRNLAGVASGAISLLNLYGKSNVTFTPAGGGTAQTAVYVDGYGIEYASVTLQCSQNAAWTYSPPSWGDVSIPSGASATTITFSISTNFNPQNASWTVSATAGGVTQHWVVYVMAFGFA